MKLPSLLSLAAAAACLGAASTPAEEGGWALRVGRTVEISRSHGHCWFPTIHRFRSGEIMVTMDLCPDEANYESEFSGYCISKDGGLTWSQRHPMGFGTTQDGAWAEEPDENDAIWHWCCYAEPFGQGQPAKYYGAMTKLSRGGRFSTEDRDVTFTLKDPAYMGPTGLFEYWFNGTSHVPDTALLSYPIAMTWGDMIRRPGGELLSGAYYVSEPDAEAKGLQNNPSEGPYHFVLLRSTDGGHEWTEYSTIAAVPSSGRPKWMGKEGPNEGSIAVLGDGRLYAVYRTGGGGQIGNSWSSDGGKTWTAPAPIGFEGVAPRVHRLGNRMLVLVTGRPGPVVIRINPDGKGEHWSPPTTLFSEMSTRYTDVLEVAPNKLLVVYDSVPYGWYDIPLSNRDARNRVLGTFVDLIPPSSD